MDQTGIFAEYARILQDTESWVSTGWPNPENETSYTIPMHLSQLRTDEGTSPRADSSYRRRSHVQNASSLMLRPDYSSLSAMFPIPEEVSPGSGNPDQINGIEDQIRACEKCNLFLTCLTKLPGWGPSTAELMVVCAPPAGPIQENAIPLTARDHDYFNKWLIALKLDPNRDVFITPALKCSTPGGRPPHPEEAAACAGYLRSQYHAVTPKAILALGDTACGILTGNPRHFASLVGKKWQWGAVPALVLWTPAEVLASPNRLRRPVWEALQQFRALW